ncbi:MAG TPA: FAD-dependent monooxygenase [Baekduia sp.]|nr:FAD-dependent monooxygenase [Baekduia sp.]
MPRPEQVDVVVIGARCAGAAAAITFANAGRRVLAVDRSAFPSDTLSTHANFPSAVAEIQRLGALARVRRANGPECREGMVWADGVPCLGRFSPVDGIDYALSNPRPAFDLALVETAREAGAEVRERTSLVDVVWRDGRAAGVRLRDRDGTEHVVRAKLVVGADGRRSLTAYRVGADAPYRGSANDRGAAFFYCDDPQIGTAWRGRLAQLRAGTTHTFVFPCPDGRLLVLFMGPQSDVAAFRRDPMGTWDRLVQENPLARERLEGAANHTKVRSTASMASFFRRSSGPGWALVGDAGHFKDPVIGQGMRDAMRFGRLLGEAAAPVLDDPQRLDRALLAAERRRDRECLATYHWGNRESRVTTPTPLVKEVLRAWDGRSPNPALEMFDRRRAPHRVLNPLVGARAAARAALRPGTDRRALLAEVREELRIDAGVWLEELTHPFRPTRRRPSERPGFAWPSAAPAPARPAPADADALEPVAA